MNRLLLNWKTSSIGILAILGGLVRVCFAITNHSFTEEAVMTALTTIVGGIGFLFTRDADVSSVDMGIQTVQTKASATKVVVDKPEGK